ncbi:hypothetical protein PFISCL1PPCAC_6426, partial [Pristionchus fissidentatus]
CFSSSFFSLLFLPSKSSSTTPNSLIFQTQNARLYNDLFSSYRREMSPYNGHGMSNNSYPLTPVIISLQYARLIRVLEPELQHQDLVGILVDWRDPRLNWNPADYGGIDHIYVNRYIVWMPDSQGLPVSSDHTLNIRVNASGFLNTFVLYSSYYSCEFDVRRFPFDKQDCYYCFLLYNYDSKDEMTMVPKIAADPYIYDTSEWALGLHGHIYMESISPDFNMGLLFFNISLTRRPQFWIGLVITPTFVIGSLIIIGLFFGRGADLINNAVGLGLTSMMSMMVIVGILADAIAKSQYIPILGWYIIAEIIIITLAVFALLSSEVTYTYCSINL